MGCQCRRRRISLVSHNAENFDALMVVYMEEEQEEQIFGHSDAHLRCIEVHSQTLIQLERGSTATGETRVTIFGPLWAQLCEMDLICSVGSPDSYIYARGREMLQRVQSRPLTEDDLEVPCRVCRTPTMSLRPSG